MAQALILRRKKEGLTDYQKRLRLLKSGLPRAVVRPTNKGILVQIVSYDPAGDKVEVTVTNRTLAKMGLTLTGNSTPVCYLAGYLAGNLAKNRKIKEAVLDSGRLKVIKGGRIAAALNGLVDSGLKVPHDKSIFPTKQRLNGQHLKTKPEALNTLKEKLVVKK
ncbi:50S ribosomal protein L18 [Thermoplasmatales archaeon AK]|nr:50S ribosomal protein L18 [Thermoplasmatales archaeon AK]